MKMTTTKEINRPSKAGIMIVILLMMPALAINFWYAFRFAPTCWILETTDMPLTKTKSEIETTTTESGIPKIIHLIWLTARNSSSSLSQNNTTDSTTTSEDAVETLIPKDGPLPEDVVLSIKRYKELHADYQIKVWRNKDILTTFPELTSLVKTLTVHAKFLAWLSDVVRYAVVLKFGGIYLDTDLDILHSLEPLRACFPNGYTVCEYPPDKDKLIQPKDIHSVQDLVMPHHCKSVNNQMAAPPAHIALLKAYVMGVQNSFNSLGAVEKGDASKTVYIAGPAVWTKSVQESNFTVLIGNVYYPCPYDKRFHCNSSDYVNDSYAYLMHKWAASWTKQPTKNGKQPTKRQMMMMRKNIMRRH